ncbi:hypothetical protein D3C80_1668530 [compost metagenome]
MATELRPLALALEPMAVLWSATASAPAPPATESLPVALGLGRRLVLFTWNIPSVPFCTLVTSPSTLVTRLSRLLTLVVTLAISVLTLWMESSVYCLDSATAPSSWRRLTASVACLPSATLLRLRLSPVAALPMDTVPDVELLALEYLPV